MDFIKNIKTVFGKISKKISEWNLLFDNFITKKSSPISDEQPPYQHCLNCNAELQGMYCHRCGQHASTPIPKMSNFIKEYIKNILAIERQTLPTLKNLIFNPGLLVKEYCQGRYTTYLHPLKFNLFTLVILITVFVVFNTDKKVEESYLNLTNEEYFITEVSLSTNIAIQKSTAPKYKIVSATVMDEPMASDHRPIMVILQPKKKNFNL